jgi:hypothetical protein
MDEKFVAFPQIDNRALSGLARSQRLGWGEGRPARSEPRSGSTFPLQPEHARKLPQCVATSIGLNAANDFNAFFIHQPIHPFTRTMISGRRGDLARRVADISPEIANQLPDPGGGSARDLQNPVGVGLTESGCGLRVALTYEGTDKTPAIVNDFQAS